MILLSTSKFASIGYLWELISRSLQMKPLMQNVKEKLLQFNLGNKGKTSETVSDSAECYAGLSVHFESSAACM